MKTKIMIATLLILSIYMLLQGYSGIQGFTHGILYSRKGKYAFIWDEHMLFVAERTVIGSIVVLGIIAGQFIYFERMVYYPVFYCTLAICTFLSFSFWHSGFYNIALKKIGISENDFMDDTEIDGVALHFNKVAKVLGLIIGWSGMILCCKAFLL